MLPAATTDHSALVSAPSRDTRGSHPSSEKDNLFCDYCRRPRHTRETCWKLHGTPSGGREDRPGTREDRSGQSRGRGANARAHLSDTVEPPFSSPVVSLVADVSGLFIPDFEITLRHLLDCRAFTFATGARSSSFVNSGNLVASPCVLLSHTPVSWIIDSSASDYMFGSSNLFSEYNPSSSQEKVRIADGTMASMSGKDLIMRKRIGSGREEHSLYILDQTDKLTHSSIQSPSTKDNIWLW